MPSPGRPTARSERGLRGLGGLGREVGELLAQNSDRHLGRGTLRGAEALVAARDLVELADDQTTRRLAAQGERSARAGKLPPAQRRALQDELQERVEAELSPGAEALRSWRAATAAVRKMRRKAWGPGRRRVRAWLTRRARLDLAPQDTVRLTPERAQDYHRAPGPLTREDLEAASSAAGRLVARTQVERPDPMLRPETQPGTAAPMAVAVEGELGCEGWKEGER